MEPVLGVVKENVTTVKYRGQMVERKTYDLYVNRYYELGIVYRVFSYAEFQKIQDWQNETGIQVIYPYVDPADIGGSTDTPNIWYQVDGSGSAVTLTLPLTQSGGKAYDAGADSIGIFAEILGE